MVVVRVVSFRVRRRRPIFFFFGLVLLGWVGLFFVGGKVLVV